jgi:hypothetical protein
MDLAGSPHDMSYKTYKDRHQHATFFLSSVGFRLRDTADRTWPEGDCPIFCAD